MGRAVQSCSDAAVLDSARLHDLRAAVRDPPLPIRLLWENPLQSLPRPGRARGRAGSAIPSPPRQGSSRKACRMQPLKQRSPLQGGEAGGQIPCPDTMGGRGGVNCTPGQALWWLPCCQEAGGPWLQSQRI